MLYSQRCWLFRDLTGSRKRRLKYPMAGYAQQKQHMVAWTVQV